MPVTGAKPDGRPTGPTGLIGPTVPIARIGPTVLIDPSGPTGTVTLIKGTTLYITDSSGTTSLVKTSAASRVTKTVTSSVKNIKPGSVVTVVGTQAKDGSYTATSISVANGG